MLEALGIILLIVIGKFVYDTYLSSNTKENWEDYKQDNPAKAYEIERNKGLNFSTSQAAKQTDSLANLSELQQLMIRLSSDLYKRVEARENYFEFSVEGKRNIEQYFKSICSILSAAVFETAFDLDNVAQNESIRKELKSNLGKSYLIFASHLIKTNRVISPRLQSLSTNDNAIALHAIVEMGHYSSAIKTYLSTGKLSYLETTEDDDDPYTYEKEVQYNFIRDIYEVGFDEVGSSIRVNHGELKYDIAECKSDIADLLYFIRTYITQLKQS